MLLYLFSSNFFSYFIFNTIIVDGFQLLNSRNCALNLSGYKYSFAVFA